MLCDHSDFRLKLAEELGFAVCNPAAEDFAARAAAYFGTAPSLSGPTADIDCWLDAAGGCAGCAGDHVLRQVGFGAHHHP